MAHSQGNGKPTARVIKDHPGYSLLESKNILIVDPFTDIFNVEPPDTLTEVMWMKEPSTVCGFLLFFIHQSPFSCHKLP